MSTATFSVTTVNVSTSSPQLASLAGREYSSDYTSLPNANLPKALRRDLDVVFTFLTGESLPLDENTFLIKSSDGVYSRLFGPVLKAGSSEVEGTKEGELCIQWGPRYIPLQSVKGGFTLESGTEVEAEFGTYNFSGRGEDPALFVSVDTPEGQTILPVAVRFIDWQNQPEAKALNALLKKKPEEVVNFIQVVTARASGGGRVETDSEADFKTLPLNEPFEVVHYYPCNTQYGKTYRIVIKDYPEEGNMAAAWAHTSIRPLLSTEPVISEESPATLTVRSREEFAEGKMRIRATLLLSPQEVDGEEELNLDF